MKIRLDFVTNSSGTSYVCEVCGEAVGDSDRSLLDAEMQECVKGHVVCTSHVEISEEDKEILEEYPYEVPSDLCPICTMEYIRDRDLLNYVLTTTGQFSSREAAAKDMRAGCANLEQAKKWLARNQW